MTPSPRQIGKYMHALLAVNGTWIVSNRSDVLGSIEWHAKWRQHQFVPDPCTAFTVSCLTPLAAFMAELDAERRLRP